MSKSSSHLGRSGSAGSKSPSFRKELQGNRSCMLRIGERLMRAGSEGNLVQRPIPAQSQRQSQTSSAGLGQGLNGQTQLPVLEDKPTEPTGNNSSNGNSPSRGSSSSSSSAAVDSSTERLLQKKQHTNSSALCNLDFSSYGSAPCSANTLPRSHATAAGASSRDSQLHSQLMQHSDVERKKEVFMDHLRQKYPHQAAIIMGHQGRVRKQVGSPRPSENPPSAGVLGLAEQQDPLALEAMSDGEVLHPTVPFSRGCKARASLPVRRSSDSQTRERPLGVLYLQYGEETKQVRMPAEISSQDALQVLFVTAFPHQLTMKMLQSPNMAIYIKDTSRNVYYDLEDMRNITSYSCLKVYHKDPAHVFNPHTRPASTEGRISKEVLYGSHSPVHTLSSSSRSTLHSLQSSMSPPMVRSMPSSPSRIPYGGGNTGGSVGLVDPGSATLPRERLSGVRRSSALCTNSSSILERRDVKPDEDAARSKSMALVVRGEGGHYPDSYCSSLQDRGGGRLSMASQCSAPPSVTADMVDAGVTGIPGGMQQFRATIKPLMGYGESVEHQTHSLQRQKSRKYGDSQLPPLGTKTPPPSPHRVSEARMIDGQIIGGIGLVSPERMSPVRRSLRRDSNGATVEIINRSRGSGSSSSTSSVFVDSPVGQPERAFQGHVTANAAQSERIKAMEEQIASLAGLVQHALSVGGDVPAVKDAVSETYAHKLLIPGTSSEPQNAAALIDSSSYTPLALQVPPSDCRLRQSLVLAKSNVNELRLQLNELRLLQLSNQESVSSMLRMAGQELMVLMCDRLAQSEETVYRQRSELEEEMSHYLAKEKRILTELSELEDYVDRWQRSSTSSPGQLSITLRDVEEGAVNLQRVGEAVAILKDEFSELQLKMRSVLRLEVEVVRFLKEEPHKMDSMLKRVKALTEALSALRRCVSDSAPPATSAQVESLKTIETDQGPSKTRSPQSSPKPHPRSSVRHTSLPPPLPTPSLSQGEVGPAGSASPILFRRMKSGAATMIQPSHNHPNPPLTPTHGRDSPSVAKVSPCNREGSLALQKTAIPLQSDQLCSSAGGSRQPAQTAALESHTDQNTNTHTHTETAGRQTPEGQKTSSVNPTSTSQASQPPNFDSSQPPPCNTNTDFNQVQQEDQAGLMKSDTTEGHSNSASALITSTALKSEKDASQASVEQQPPLSDTHKNTPLKLRDEVDSSQFKSPDTAGPSQHPAATVEPPLTAPPSAIPNAGCASGPQVEKPRRSTVDKEVKQSPDMEDHTSKFFPPPPPPRRFHAVSSGLTTGRSGEVIFTTRKEQVGAQDEGEKEKEPPVVPQPKPTRQPPEVKPKPKAKPQMCAPALAGSRSTPATASAHTNKEEEEQDNQFMRQLQVTTDLSIYNDLPGGNKQWNREARTPPTLSSELVTLSNQLCPQLKITNGCPHKLITQAEQEDHNEIGKNSECPEKEKKVAHSLNCVTVERVEVPPPVAIQDVQTVQKNEEVQTQRKAEKVEVLNDLSVVTSDQMNKEVVGQVFSPTAAEKKVKFTTVALLQKENIQAIGITSPDQTNKNAIKEVPVEKKTNVMVVVTLQKENTTEDGSMESSPKFQEDTCLNSDSECVASVPVLKVSPSLTYSHGSKQQIQEAAVQVSSEQSQYREEGGSLNPNIWDDEGPPPPPPPAGKISLRISKSKLRTQSKEEDQVKMSGSDFQTGTGDSTGEPTYLVHENHSFEVSDDSDRSPIIVFLNEPIDIYSAYKRLSTIFESEEDLDGILSPECIADEEERKQEEQIQHVRQNCFTQLNCDVGRKDITGNGQNFLQHQRPSADNGSVPENQDQSKPEKIETKRKFKFKFPKNKLAAITQAIRTGTSKTGKKTLEVVVYEDRKEIPSDSRPVKETKEQVSSANDTRLSKSHSRVEELCKNTFDSIDSLEESIKQLEISVDSITASPPHSPNSSFDSPDRAQLKSTVKRERERSPSKRPATHILKGPNPSQSKRAKAQPPHKTGRTSTKKQSSSSSSSSSAQHLRTESRHSSSSCSPKKTPQGQKQSSQPRLVAIPR